MATEGQLSDVCKFGYVEFRSKRIKRWKRRWLVLYRGTQTRPACIVKYTDEREEQNGGKGRHTYLVTDLLDIGRMKNSEKEKAVRVILSSPDVKEICFSFDSVAAADDWVKSLRSLKLESMDRFPARVLQAAHASFDGDVTLHIQAKNVAVIPVDSPAVVIPLTTIKTYKQESENVFWIETGSQSPMGTGLMTFQSEFAHVVLVKIEDAAKALSNRYKDVSPSSTVSTGSSHSGGQVHKVKTPPPSVPPRTVFSPTPQPSDPTPISRVLVPFPSLHQMSPTKHQQPVPPVLPRRGQEENKSPRGNQVTRAGEPRAKPRLKPRGGGNTVDNRHHGDFSNGRNPKQSGLRAYPADDVGLGSHLPRLQLVTQARSQPNLLDIQETDDTQGFRDRLHYQFNAQHDQDTYLHPPPGSPDTIPRPEDEEQDSDSEQDIYLHAVRDDIVVPKKNRKQGRPR